MALTKLQNKTFQWTLLSKKNVANKLYGFFKKEIYTLAYLSLLPNTIYIISSEKQNNCQKWQITLI